MMPPIRRRGWTGINLQMSKSAATTSTYFRTPHFTDLVLIELILLRIVSYLRVPSLLALSSTSKAISSIMLSVVGVWSRIDLSELMIQNREESIIKFLRQPHVVRDCRQLILDGTDLPQIVIHKIVVCEVPRLESLSLHNCLGLEGDRLMELIDYIRRPSAPRPLSFQYMALLGGALFSLNEPSFYAPHVVSATGNEIQTDIHSLQCLGKSHIMADGDEAKWHLAPYSNLCAICGGKQKVCMKCQIQNSYPRCDSFYCDNFGPELNVHPCESVVNVAVDDRVSGMRNIMQSLSRAHYGEM